MCKSVCTIKARFYHSLSLGKGHSKVVPILIDSHSEAALHSCHYVFRPVHDYFRGVCTWVYCATAM
jgi:hypothetical protein